MKQLTTLCYDIGDARLSECTGAARCTAAGFWSVISVVLGDHVREQSAADAALGAFLRHAARNMECIALALHTSDRQTEGRTSG